MQKLRILCASALLTITGVAVFGVKAIAAPPTSNPIPPQACSIGGTGNTSSGVAAGSVGYTGNSGFGSSSGGSTTTSGSGSGSDGS